MGLKASGMRSEERPRNQGAGVIASPSMPDPVGVQASEPSHTRSEINRSSVGASPLQTQAQAAPDPDVVVSSHIVDQMERGSQQQRTPPAPDELVSRANPRIENVSWPRLRAKIQEVLQQRMRWIERNLNANFRY